MSRIEDRLRDAYHSAAEAVTPARTGWSGEQPAPGPRRASRMRVLAPVAAAGAVALIAVLGTALPRVAGTQHGSSTPPAGVPAGAPRFLIAEATGTSPLQVRDAATGALIARISLPSHGYRTYIGSVASSDDRTYVVSVFHAGPCRSWLYQFRLDDNGRPSAVTPFRALPMVREFLYGMVISGNGQMLGYAATDFCPGVEGAHEYVGVFNIGTGQSRQWAIPDDNSVNNVSLTADGRMLSYSLQLSPSVVRVMPTNAAAGTAAERSRVVVRATQFGNASWISFAALSPAGKTAYFTIYQQFQGVARNDAEREGQVEAVDLATGRTREVYAPAGSAGLITVDSSVSYMLTQVSQLSQASHKRTVMLAVLSLATGQVTYLPSTWLSLPGEVIRW